jgi:glycosyltransferase involved in cell wall biosynthesis
MPEVAGDAAILINPYSVDEISQAMTKLATSTELTSQLSELGLARAKKFSWYKTGQATQDILSRYL